MSKRNNQFLLEDIVEAISRIKDYSFNLTFESFTEDQKTIDAIIRNFEIIGEAANRLESDFKLTNADIPWLQLSDFRNRLIHEYFGVDLEIVWDIIKLELDELQQKIKNIDQ